MCVSHTHTCQGDGEEGGRCVPHMCHTDVYEYVYSVLNALVYRAAKTHRMPYVAGHFSPKNH